MEKSSRTGFKSLVPETMNILEQFSSVERRINRGSLGRFENDVEHSFDLAIVAIGIIRNDNLPLDEAEVIRFALVHDLVETYAGDAFALDEDGRVDKEEREKEALKKITNNPAVNFLVSDIEEYERKDSEEAKFVYGLDKLLPAIQIINSQQTIHAEGGTTLEKWKEIFEPKVKISKYLVPYFNETFELLTKNSHLFCD